MAEQAASDIPGSNPGDTAPGSTGPRSDVADLVSRFAEYDRAFEKWKKRTDKIIKRYRDENRDINSGGDSVKFNILWSNVQTLIPAVFARLPRPDVSRRYRDSDPVARVAALILERALDFEVQQYPDYQASMSESVLDRFLGGRGTAWVRYEPHFKAAAEQMPTDGVQITEDVDEPGEQLDYECTPVDYVHWQDFGHSVARTWEEVDLVWRVVYMDKDAVTARFGEEWAAKIPYDSGIETKTVFAAGWGAVSFGTKHTQAKIYEVWDKRTKRAIWLSYSLKQIVDERDDPLGLAEFWPCPKPLYATLTNETLVPVADFALYQDQAIELDILSDRVDGLIKALQVKGCYDSSIPELARLFSEAGNTDMIPVKNMAAFSEKNGLKGSIDLVDLKPIYEALKVGFEAMGAIKEIIYEITGISDIVRGQTNASETLGAQEIKQNFVGLRLSSMQNAVARYAAEILCIKGQIICAKYAPETIMQIAAVDQLSPADQAVVPDAIALLIGPERMANPEAEPGPNPTRRFRIDIESDSLVKLDEQQEKTDRMEFLKATGAFIKDSVPVAQADPKMAPLIGQMLLFGIRGFKVGRTIEGEFEQTLDELRKVAAQPQPPKQDPEMVKAQAQVQADQMRMQFDQQREDMKMRFEQDREAQKIAMEQQAAERDAQREMQMKQIEAQLNARAEAEKAAFEEWKTQLVEANKFAIAQLSAQTTVKTASMSANAANDGETATEFSEEGEKKPTSAFTELAERMDKVLLTAIDGMSRSNSESMAQLVAEMRRPRRAIRGPDGRIAGAE